MVKTIGAGKFSELGDKRLLFTSSQRRLHAIDGVEIQGTRPP